MRPKLLPEGLRAEPWFRWRGGEVSRLEALSDAVFALSLTLLVVALTGLLLLFFVVFYVYPLKFLASA